VSQSRRRLISRQRLSREHHSLAAPPHPRLVCPRDTRPDHDKPAGLRTWWSVRPTQFPQSSDQRRKPG